MKDKNEVDHTNPVSPTRVPVTPLTKRDERSNDTLGTDATRQFREIGDWVAENDLRTTVKESKTKARSGYCVLFQGGADSEKTEAVARIGKHANREVFRVDLSQHISKYIGETEKNLSRLFDRAEQKKWILFFDEADALFGKRSDVQDSHDRYANQEVSYLLQRIERYHGIVIFATNKAPDIENPLRRRMQSVVHFPLHG